MINDTTTANKKQQTNKQTNKTNVLLPVEASNDSATTESVVSRSAHTNLQILFLKLTILSKLCAGKNGIDSTPEMRSPLANQDTLTGRKGGRIRGDPTVNHSSPCLLSLPSLLQLPGSPSLFSSVLLKTRMNSANSPSFPMSSSYVPISVMLPSSRERTRSHCGRNPMPWVTSTRAWAERN